MRLFKLSHKITNKVFWSIEKDGVYYLSLNPSFEEIDISKEISIYDYKILPPFFGSKAIGFSLNYKSLIGQSKNEPLFFFKNHNSIITDKDPIIIKEFNSKVWIEVELVIVIKSKCKDISYDDAHDFILGYTIGNDVTAENLYNRDWHLGRAKGQDTFCPIGSFINEPISTNNLKMRSLINEKVFQEGNTSEMLYNCYKCVELASQYCTLFPGDLIFTGTPAGATDALIKKGDKVQIEIENIGILQNEII